MAITQIEKPQHKSNTMQKELDERLKHPPNCPVNLEFYIFFNPLSAKDIVYSDHQLYSKFTGLMLHKQKPYKQS